MTSEHCQVGCTCKACCTHVVAQHWDVDVAEPAAEGQTADAVQKAADATDSQKAAVVAKAKRGTVQQILSSLLPQTKTVLPCDVKSKSKKRSHYDIMDKPVGLKTSSRLTRSRSIKVM